MPFSRNTAWIALLLVVVAPAHAADPIASLRAYLATPQADRLPLAEQPFASAPLSRSEATKASRLLWQDHAAVIRETRAGEMKARELKLDGLILRFAYKTFGDKPEAGRSLYLSMHGGGGAPARVNDQQWENQKALYQPAEGVYLAPRAATDTWDLWHQPHIDRFFDRLIENLIVLEDVNPNRVYVMGYSAGGDGVYQLGPRMADRWAAAAMMAGHPNDASPLGLRNLPFAIYMGGRDAAYKRNEIAAEWKVKLDALAQADPTGYPHRVTIYPDKGHWMDREDASALPWMAGHTRDPLPTKVVWRQDDVTHNRFYWLAAGDHPAKPHTTVTATRKGQAIDLQPEGFTGVAVRLNDEMLDLDQPIRITANSRLLFEGKAKRTVATLAKTLEERGDPRSVFAAEVVVDFPE